MCSLPAIEHSQATAKAYGMIVACWHNPGSPYPHLALPANRAACYKQVNYTLRPYFKYQCVHVALHPRLGVALQASARKVIRIKQTRFGLLPTTCSNDNNKWWLGYVL